LFTFDNKDDMNVKEAELVSKDFVKEETNYNLCPGGHGGWGYVNSNGLADYKIAGRNGGLSKHSRVGCKNPIVREKMSAGRRKKYPNGTFYNRQHSEEWKENHSRVMKEKSLGIKNSQFGTIWITNGSESKKIKKDEIIPEGWNKGRKQKL
jgi:hypothetical protein